MPPTLRWPFRLVKPASTDSLTNLASSSSLAVRNTTFISERESFSTAQVKRREASMVS